MAVIALGKVMAEKVGCPQNHIFDQAFDAWCFHPTAANLDMLAKWIDEFDQAVWQGRDQEAHKSLSFVILIIERQADHLTGRKLVAVNDIIDYLCELYEMLEPADNGDEYTLNQQAAEAADIWQKVIDK